MMIFAKYYTFFERKLKQYKYVNINMCAVTCDF